MTEDEKREALKLADQVTRGALPTPSGVELLARVVVDLNGEIGRRPAPLKTEDLAGLRYLLRVVTAGPPVYKAEWEWAIDALERLVGKPATCRRAASDTAAIVAPLDTSVIANTIRAFDGEVERALKDLVGMGYALESMRLVEHPVLPPDIKRTVIESAGRPVYGLTASVHGGDSPRFDIVGALLPPAPEGT